MHCVPQAPPTDGSLPNSFQKRGTDCVVVLDPVAMKENYDLFQTASDTVLIKKPVAVRDILKKSLCWASRVIRCGTSRPRRG